MGKGTAIAVFVAYGAILAGCGSNSATSAPPAAQSHRIGGTVSGLDGAGLVLADNGTDSLTVNGNGTFEFPTSVVTGQAYSVTVTSQPTTSGGALPQTCFVNSGSGMVADADVQSVVISCVNNAARYAYVVDQGSSQVSGYSINNQTGALTAISGSPFPAGADPEALTIHPSGKFAYASNAGDSTISEYTIDSATGALAAVSGSPLPVSPAATLSGYSIMPVVIDPSGKLAFVANPGAAFAPPTQPQQPDNLNAYSIDTTSGALTAISGSPLATGSDFPSFIAINAGDTVAYVVNDQWQTGADQCSLSVFDIDPTTASVTAVAGSPFEAPPACRQEGPSSFVLGSSAQVAYLTDPPGALVSLQWLTLNPTTGAVTGSGQPATAPTTSSTSAAVIDASGKFLYLAGPSPTNGNQDVVYEYSVAATGGTLTYIGTVPTGAANPIAIDPTGNYLYEADATSIYAYAIDSSTGALTAVSGSPFTVAGSSDSIAGLIAIDPSGRFAYVPSASSSAIYALSIDSTTGALSPVAGSPFASGTSPGKISFLN